ncbi:MULTISPECIES: SEFIR domain-containing protein [unclassified Pseudomonas]|uniref:SEFIR domain-containing protein n=1 Tax=unclassified Pseudomonas TaxID=196821 RepID=UPI000CD0AEB1|nr:MULTISPECIES: SEFIR domain-containing protein [unclassified Pseudomonas]POA23575.1 hypothetical protein C1895_18895 [Pseudomonas sp. FW305-3-2-15-E-TSA4]POA35350.1 hypothetical protein C1894_25925 [Pseudomonas sp. FW305-3-2-15-E-TSA2]
MDATDTPKLFISYSWTSPEHETWVEELAQELAAGGVHVILDKWDLREGQESAAFMEQMVTDPGVGKVILICDKTYADKANSRTGGVGTEAQIISAEIYQAASTTKFVAVVREYDEHGKACVPKYYSSRIYIDLSDSPRYASEFDRLIRWAHDQPLHVRPPTGKKPSYLERENRAITLVTSAEHRRAVDAIKNDRTYADAAIGDYFKVLADGVEQFRIPKPSPVEYDELVIKSIEDFLPYRNEAIELILTIGRYRDNSDTRRHVHRFFERLLPYQERPQSVTQWNDSDFDNFRFIVHELFLYGVAALLKEERFEFAANLLTTPFYVPGRSEYGRDVTVGFEAFRTYAAMFDHRNKRLSLRRISLRADLLEQRCHSSGFTMQELMQADFVLFLRSNTVQVNQTFPWYPETLLYVGRHSGPFEIFARSRSEQYFESVRKLLGITTKAQLGELLTDFEEERRRLPRWDYQSLSPRPLTGFDDLGVVP